MSSMVDGADHTAQYPVEYVKTRRQLPASKGLSSLEIIRATVAKDGLRGLYSGCSVLAASNAAKSGIRFLGFETARSSLPSLFPNLAGTSMLNVYSGLCAGVAESILVVTPGEAVKTRIVNAAATGQAKGDSARTTQVIAAMLRQNGVLAFWRGLSPVLCKQGTNSAVRFSTFGAFKDILNKWDFARAYASQSFLTFSAGAGSGVVTVYASMPFDNIKTVLQTQTAGRGSMIACARDMLAKEGVRVFWKATTPRLVRLTFSSSITFTVYDYVVHALRPSHGVE